MTAMLSTGYIMNCKCKNISVQSKCVSLQWTNESKDWVSGSSLVVETDGDGDVWVMMSAEKPLNWDLPNSGWLYYLGRSGPSCQRGVGGRISLELEPLLCTDKQRWRQWRQVGEDFHVNCDSVILLALFISISPEVRILCVSGRTFLSIFFFFFILFELCEF